MTAALLAALDPKPGDTVLDLAAGTGDMAAALAGRVARILCTDLSPVMVEAARRRGIANAEHRVLDMQALDLEAASVDAVVCRFGYMLVPDPVSALRETRRVLRPGGRLAFATWAPAERNPWATAYGPVLIERGLQEPPKRGEPGQFALSATERDRVARSGGRVPGDRDRRGRGRVPIRELGRLPPRDHEPRRVSARDSLAQLDERTRSEIDDGARARIERFRTETGYVLPGVALVTSAR